MSNPLDQLARRAGERPAYLAAALADFSESEGLNDSGLANKLGCDLETLIRLRLCLRPRAEMTWFRRDIEEISHRFGVAPDVLAGVVRRSDALARLRRPASSNHGFLMAARDREHAADSDADPESK